MSGQGLHFGVFAKYWEPGRVKTRLAARVGDAVAASIYRTFIAQLLVRLADAGESRELVFAPDGRGNAFRRLAADVSDRWSYVPQGDGDLGQRMERFFERHVEQPNGTILIGSDSPTLPDEYLARASALLEKHSVVLGPSEDGGYYLVGVRGAVPPIFSGIAWSSNKVFEQTTRCLVASNVRYACLPSWYDVDDVFDLRRLLLELKAAAAHSWERQFYLEIQGFWKEQSEQHGIDLF